MLQYARSFLRAKFDYDLDVLIKRSKLFKSLWGQKKLREF